MSDNPLFSQQPRLPSTEDGTRQDRRSFLRMGAALAAAGAAGLVTTRSAPALAQNVETIDITPKLIDAAKREGTLTVRYSSPVDEMTEMARAFTTKFGIKVQ